MNNEMIKHVKLNEDNKIEVCVDESFSIFLQDPNIENMVIESCKSLLAHRFIDLQLNGNTAFISVAPGTEGESLNLVETELVVGIQMAMAFFSSMGTDSLA